MLRAGGRRAMLFNRVAGPFVWNQSDKSADIALTNEGATATNGNASSTGTSSVRSLVSFSQGKLYVEFLIGLGSTNANTGVGIAYPTLALNAYFGSVAGGIGIGFDGSFANGGTYVGSGLTFATGDIIMLAYDLNARKYYAGKNGVWVGSPAAGTGGQSFANSGGGGQTYQLAASLSKQGASATIRANAISQLYAAPSGFVPIG